MTYLHFSALSHELAAGRHTLVVSRWMVQFLQQALFLSLLRMSRSTAKGETHSHTEPLVNVQLVDAAWVEGTLNDPATVALLASFANAVSAHVAIE